MLAVLIALSVSVSAFAQDADAPAAESPAAREKHFSDHSLWLPSLSVPYSNNIYWHQELHAATPPGFEGKGAWLPAGWDGTSASNRISSFGMGLSVEMGYDWDGWLFSAGFTYHSYFPGSDPMNLMLDFTNYIVKMSVSKIIGHDHITCLPTWLDFRLQAGIGFDFMSARYYASYEAKQAVTDKDMSTSTWSWGLETNLGVFVEINKPRNVTPYIGFDANFVFDKGGTFIFPSIIVGYRVCGTN